MDIYITQNSFYFVHRHFIKFFEAKNTEIIFVKEKKRGLILKYKEIFENFGFRNFLLLVFMEILTRILFYNRYKSLAKNFVNDNQLNSFLEFKLKSDKVNRVISLGCPCKISTELKTRYKTIIINIHGGIIPFQKGRFSPIKGIRNKHKFLGVTIHHIAENFDEGEIISQDYFQLNDSKILNNYNKVIKLSSSLLELYLKDKFKKIPSRIKNKII
jgi:hypothetical protein